VDLLGDGHEAELELSARLDHAAAALVADVLQRRRDVDLLAALRHAVEDHVDEDVRPGAAHAVAAVHRDRAAPAAVRLSPSDGTQAAPSWMLARLPRATIGSGTA